MSGLIVIGYPDEHAGHRMADAVARLARERVIALDAIAVVTRDRTMNLHVKASRSAAAAGAAWGALLGALSGLLVFTPLPAMVTGAAIGVVSVEMARAGVEADFRDWAGQLVRPGSSAVFIVVRQALPSAAVAVLTDHGGSVLVTPPRTTATGSSRHAHSTPVHDQRVDHDDIQSDHED